MSVCNDSFEGLNYIQTPGFEFYFIFFFSFFIFFFHFIFYFSFQDSLLASPIILDLIILCEICERIQFKVEGEKEFQSFNSVLSILSYLLKAPLVPKNTPLVNALFKQRSCIENIFRYYTLFIGFISIIYTM